MSRDNKLISCGNWTIWIMEKDNFSWTVYIEEKQSQKNVLSKSHRIGGVCPKCGEEVLDGGECDKLTEQEVIDDYKNGRLREIFEPTEVERD